MPWAKIDPSKITRFGVWTDVGEFEWQCDTSIVDGTTWGVYTARSERLIPIRSNAVNTCTVISARRFCNRVTQTRRAESKARQRIVITQKPSTGFSRRFSCFHDHRRRFLAKLVPNYRYRYSRPDLAATLLSVTVPKPNRTIRPCSANGVSWKSFSSFPWNVLPPPDFGNGYSRQRISCPHLSRYPGFISISVIHLLRLINIYMRLCIKCLYIFIHTYTYIYEYLYVCLINI